MILIEAVAKVKAAKKGKERLKVINKILEDTPNFKTQAGRTEMHQRALLMTSLRTQGIWP